MKTFTRTIEDFVCENCTAEMKGNGYTNHCSNCLWSKHVDNNPGDRMNACLGLMRPVGYDQKKGILHKCQSCNFERYNKQQPQDNFDKVVELSATMV